MSLQRIIRELSAYKEQHPGADKAEIQRAFVAIQSDAQKERSVYVATDFAMRFSEANGPSFSNVVLSLSALEKYDQRIPVVLCIVRPERLEFRLINSSFLRKISHSSKELREDNVRGSFLGHDIATEFNEFRNEPGNFDDLYSIHQDFSWQENLQRLVEATNNIVPTGKRFEPTDEQRKMIQDASARADEFARSKAADDLERKLLTSMCQRKIELLEAAETDNVNLRGNYIEQILSGAGNAHELGDIEFGIGDFGDFLITVDIKTKLTHLGSAPKAYNIDKMLRYLAKPKSVFLFLVVGIDIEAQDVRGKLVSVFDPNLIMNMVVQNHWAGRASRGVTQLTGNFGRVLDDSFRPSVDIDAGKKLLQSFLDM